MEKQAAAGAATVTARFRLNVTTVGARATSQELRRSRARWLGNSFVA